jgi:hypothetical protein
MPHLRKGGKYVFGWSRVGEDGSVTLPDEAYQEYHLDRFERVFLTSGSKTSGGFGITTKSFLEQSPLYGVLQANTDLANFKTLEGKAVPFKNRSICWVKISASGRIFLPSDTMPVFWIKPGDLLLSIRSSNIAIGLVVRGPLVEVAKNHPELKVFE